ncbi:dehydratase [Paraburkholderia caffeinilytica]|nr:dehydratase [Paraburkholderia caffeinilytica]
MKALAQVLGDPNPIHLDPAAVARMGLGDRVINQGPANLAYVMNMLAEALPQARLVKLDCRFVANVFAEDSVEAGGKVTAIEASPAGETVDCDVWLKVNQQSVAISGTARLYIAASSDAP